MMQLDLAFTDPPPNDNGLWQHLDEATRQAAIDQLAQAIARIVANSHPNVRETNDE